MVMVVTVHILSVNMRPLEGIRRALSLLLPPFLALPNKRARRTHSRIPSKQLDCHLSDRHLLCLGEAKLYEPFTNTRLSLHQARLFGRLADPSRQLHLSTPTKTWYNMPRRCRRRGIKAREDRFARYALLFSL